jgi:hypothetical protein
LLVARFECLAYFRVVELPCNSNDGYYYAALAVLKIGDEEIAFILNEQNLERTISV